MDPQGQVMVRGAKLRLIDLLNNEVFIGLRRVFGYGGGNGPMVKDISPEAIVIAVTDRSADAVVATYRQILNGAAPARTIVVGNRVIPFAENVPHDPPILYTDRGTGLRRLEIPRVAHLWAMAEREGWADEVVFTPSPPKPSIWGSSSDHPHDRYLVALNRLAEGTTARIAANVRHPVSMAITDIDGMRITAEFSPRTSFMSAWGMDPSRDLALDLFYLVHVSWIRLYVFDSRFAGWIGLEERFRPRDEDFVPPIGADEGDLKEEDFPHRQDLEDLRSRCAAIGWERGELARATPLG